MHVMCMFGLCDLGHIVAGILYILDRTNVALILLATVGAFKRLPSDIQLISFMLIFVMNNVFVSFQ